MQSQGFAWFTWAGLRRGCSGGALWGVVRERLCRELSGWGMSGSIGDNRARSPTGACRIKDGGSILRCFLRQASICIRAFCCGFFARTLDNGEPPSLARGFPIGAEGGTRTHTWSPILDFESSASANSTTSARTKPFYHLKSENATGPGTGTGSSRNTVQRFAGCENTQLCWTRKPTKNRTRSTPILTIRESMKRAAVRANTPA